MQVIDFFMKGSFFMKKKILSAVCALVLVFGSAAALPEGYFKTDKAITANAETEFKEYGDYTYSEIDENTVEITGYTGSDTKITIPSVIDGKKVTSIGESAFWYCTSLTSINIPNSVKSIGDWAFYSCDSLTSITIPNSVKSIGEGAFDSCDSIKTMTVTANSEDIAYNTFSNNGEPVISPENIIIEDGVESIDGYAFMNENLKSITIPKSVTSIGERAFGYHIEYDSSQYDYSYAYNYFYNEKFTVYGYRNTVAETYAELNGFNFVPLDEEQKKGDLNGNGKIDASDLLQVKSHIKKVKPLEGDDFTCADVDGNGVINAADLLKMKAHMKGVTLLW
jgi:hypothetical protein